MTKKKEEIPWPSRDEFIRWGLVPCKEPGCRVLLGPTVRGMRCARCLRAWRATKFRRREAQRRGAGGRDEARSAPTPAPPSKNVRTESRRFEP